MLTTLAASTKMAVTHSVRILRALWTPISLLLFSMKLIPSCLKWLGCNSTPTCCSHPPAVWILQQQLALGIKIEYLCPLLCRGFHLFVAVYFFLIQLGKKDSRKMTFYRNRDSFRKKKNSTVAFPPIVGMVFTFIILPNMKSLVVII